MSAISPIDAAPGMAQILLLRQVLDAKSGGAASLLNMLPAPQPIQSPGALYL